MRIDIETKTSGDRVVKVESKDVARLIAYDTKST
jgi:hypothetical protein